MTDKFSQFFIFHHFRIQMYQKFKSWKLFFLKYYFFYFFLKLKQKMMIQNVQKIVSVMNKIRQVFLGNWLFKNIIFQLFCNNLEISRVPTFWPTHFRKIVLRNSSLTTLHKNSFRKFKNLEELRIEESFQLDVIDKFAFKGLPKLRFLSLIKNKKLAQIFKSTFGGIGNEQSLKIHLKNNGLQQISPFSFKFVLSFFFENF